MLNYPLKTGWRSQYNQLLATEAISVLEIKGSYEEIKRLFIESVIDESKKQAVKVGKEVVKGTVKRALSAWQKFLKTFKFRKQKRNESNAKYLGARTKAAGVAYRRTQKSRKTKGRK